MADPFATAGELAQFIGLAEPSDLARWQQHLASASALIRRFCGQQLSQVEDDQITMVPSYSVNLFLPERPATAVAVTEDAVAVTNFTLVESSGVLIRETLWDEEVVVTYDHGYAEFSPEYESLKAICLEVAARMVTMNERSASEVLGSSLLESAGYSPAAFLDQAQQWQLAGFGMAGVG